MAGRLKHMERSRRSYRQKELLLREASRHNRIKTAPLGARKARISALAALLAAAKGAMRKTQAK